MSKFQLITFGIFILFIVAGVIAFATYRSNNTSTQLPPITIWGTFPESVFNEYLNTVSQTLPEALSVTYVYKSPERFSTDFIAELARGTGPDGILITADAILPHLDKLALIPFTALPQRTFQDTFIQEGEIYYTNGGVLGIPFVVDPLVMYWNRDMFSGAGLATYPKNWDDFTDLNKKLTVRDTNGNIQKSAIALGDFTNVSNAREILGSLFFQIGNPITYTGEGGFLQSSKKSNYAGVDTSPVLEFFTKFVNPSSKDYSWNRGLPQSKSAFLSGKLATYFGFASEIGDIRLKNPNLNFDVAPFPQLKTGGKKATYGKMYGFSIARTSKNPNVVYQVVSILTNPQRLVELSKKMYLPTVSRSIIGQGSDDPYISIFNEAALVSKIWLDADTGKSRQIFGNMVDDITSGKKSVFESIQDASDQYDIILRQIYE